jgi:hypothetical protein
MGGPSGRGELLPQILTKRLDLRGDAVFDVHPEHHWIAADQHRRADQHHADRHQHDREALRGVGGTEQDHRRGDRGE